MSRVYLNRFAALAAAFLALSACSSDNKAPLNNGVFIDGPVTGLGYTAGNGAARVTGEGGTFTYRNGQDLSFSIGGIQLGSAAGAPIIMPVDVMPSARAEVNLARFLLTLDLDKDPSNGITIAEAVRTYTKDLTHAADAFDVDDAAFESSDLADIAKRANGDGPRTLVSRDFALSELTCSKNDVRDGKYDATPCKNGGQTRWLIEAGPDAQIEAISALFGAVRGDIIEFGEGHFQFDTTLVMQHKEGIVLKGQGMEKTILDFKNSRSPEGLSFSHMTGITIEALTVIDTPGFSIKVSDSNFVVMRNVRTMWSSKDGGMDPTKPATLDVECVHELSFPESTGTFTDASGVTRNYVVDKANGGYAIYPVLSSNVLLDNVIALGASDAGIYVGQSRNVIVKNSEALFNVAGFEIENTDNADVFDNVAHCNTGGFLTFDLPGLNLYGDRTRTFNNYAGYNNTANFAPGGIVSVVPQGIGMLQLGYDEHEVFGNTIEFNRTVGFVYVGHDLLGGSSDKRMDYNPDAVHVHDNIFTTNGTAPQPPKDSALVCQAGTGPGLDDVPPCIPTGVDDSDPSLLPALIQIKGTLAADGFGPTGAHIVWDGAADAPYDCELSTDAPLDANGKPQYDGGDHPSCRYNKYKFKAGTSDRKTPQYFPGGCITDSDDPGPNTFSPESRKFMNFVDTDLTNPPKVDINDHDCPTVAGAQLAALPAAVVAEYVPGAAGDPPPTRAEIDAACADYSGTAINREALAYNCNNLSEYNLFANPTDPRSGGNEGGLLFDLTTPLFSDYSKKYRLVFLPPDTPAAWREGSRTEPNATLDLPVGTVIAKTFTFPHKTTGEEIIETRLLIHRNSTDGGTHWEGLPYIWEKDAQGKRTDAKLALGGGKLTVSWDYDDPDPAVPKTYTGSTEYSIPHVNQCGTCHANDDQVAGKAPIGLKVRLMNRPMDYGSGPVNQLQHWVSAGMLSGAPALTVDGSHVATNALRAPRFNVPNDSYNIPSTETARLDQLSAAEKDKEYRARAWLETNCAHCHNQKGIAQSTGVFFDMFRTININYGICKSPTTAGSSSGGHQYDIVPGSAATSIASFRVHQADPSTQMPPLARSVVHAEGVAVFDDWIDTVVDSRYTGSDICAP